MVLRLEHPEFPLSLAAVSPILHNASMVKMLHHTWLSIPEAAEIIGCTQSYVRYLLRTETLSGEKFNARAWMVDAKSVKAFAKNPRPTGRPRSSVKKDCTDIDNVSE